MEKKTWITQVRFPKAFQIRLAIVLEYIDLHPINPNLPHPQPSKNDFVVYAVEKTLRGFEARMAEEAQAPQENKK